MSIVTHGKNKQNNIWSRLIGGILHKNKKNLVISVESVSSHYGYIYQFRESIHDVIKNLKPKTDNIDGVIYKLWRHKCPQLYREEIETL